VIEIETNISNAMRALRSAAGRQVRFATKQALNDVAYKAKEELGREARDVFHKPTPATIKAGYVTPAKQSDLTAKVWLKNQMPKGTAPNRWLAPHIKGGKRADKRSERLLRIKSVGGKYAGQPILPHGYQTFIHRDYQNKYGNITGPRMVQILSELQAFQEVGFSSNRTFRRGAYSRVGSAKPKYFVIPVQSGARHPGIYERRGKKLKMVVGFIRLPTYEAEVYDFFFTVKNTAAKNYGSFFRRRYQRALETIRI